MKQRESLIWNVYINTTVYMFAKSLSNVRHANNVQFLCSEKVDM